MFLVIILGGPICVLLGYFLSAVVIDIRVNEFRKAIYDESIRVGVNSGIERYKRELAAGEHLSSRQRRVRDEKLKIYLEKLRGMMEE